MAEFYAARGWEIPPLPWTNLSPPFSVSAIQSTIGNINGQKYGNLHLPDPALGEQRAIADFLDRETARIDQLIEKKQRMVEVLEASQESVRDGAVCKGLNPSSSYQESGMVWFGNVPAHWTKANLLSVIRQLRYSQRSENAIDVALFVNGLPVATAELKNRPTGTTFRHAEKQYRDDRSPAGEPLLTFKRGALVHFAMDEDHVSMTTRLANGKTRFLPRSACRHRHADWSPGAPSSRWCWTCRSLRNVGSGSYGRGRAHGRAS